MLLCSLVFFFCWTTKEQLFRFFCCCCLSRQECVYWIFRTHYLKIKVPLLKQLMSKHVMPPTVSSQFPLWCDQESGMMLSGQHQGGRCLLQEGAAVVSWMEMPCSGAQEWLNFLNSGIVGQHKQRLTSVLHQLTLVFLNISFLSSLNSQTGRHQQQHGLVPAAPHPDPGSSSGFALSISPIHLL